MLSPDLQPLRRGRSLLARHLSDRLHSQLTSIRSARGDSFEQLIASGLANPDSKVGVYIGDPDAYRAFAPLLDPIIEEFHGVGASTRHPGRLRRSGGAPRRPPLPSSAILSTRIRVARSLVGYRLPPTTDRSERAEVESRVKAAFADLPPDLAGSYQALPELDAARRAALVEAHLLFRSPDRFLLGGGLGRDWPEARGLFRSHNGALSAWVNEEDHLRLISLRDGGDVDAVFDDLRRFEAALAARLDFAYDDRLGYLASCPSNLGTGMRASVLVRLPRLGADIAALKRLAADYDLQVRGMHGETSDAEGGIFDVSNARRLGVTEGECVDALGGGVEALLQAESRG